MTSSSRRWRFVLRRGDDEGYSVLEAAITLPIIFFLLMVVVQWAIVWHSRNVAQAAAQEALRSAESYQSTAAAGQADGNNYLKQVAPNALGSNCVTVTRTPTTVTVRVHCKVMSVIPFGSYYATETVSGPVERYVSAPCALGRPLGRAGPARGVADARAATAWTAVRSRRWN